MKEYATEQIRNVGLVGHAAAGKTTLAEAMLFVAGETSRMGSVDEGTTVSDYHRDEIERKNSIIASVLHCNWKDFKINIIDMPGYSDFIGEVRAGLRAVDLALVVLNAQAGVEVGSETAWQTAAEYKLPRMLFVNRLDKENVDFDKVLNSARARLGDAVFPMMFPVSANEVVDVLRMKLVSFDAAGKMSHSEIPAKWQSKANEWREKLIERAAEADDKLLEKFFEAGELSAEEVKQGVRKGICQMSLFPLLCGVAPKAMGVQALLDFICEYGPAPDFRGEIEVRSAGNGQVLKRSTTDEAPFAALVFKIISEAHLGELSFFRVFCGKMTPNTEVLNTNRQTVEKLGQLFVMNGKNRKDIGHLHAGDLGAVVKLKNTHTNDTLCDKREPILLPEISFPDPLMTIAVEPKSKGDEDKISSGLHALHAEDPTFIVRVDPELRQILLQGQSELHLGLVVKRLKEKYGVDVNMVEAKIPYRETIRGSARESYRHKKQTGGAGQFGEVHFHMEGYREGAPYPDDLSIRDTEVTDLPWGGKLEFVNAIVGGAIDARFIPAVKKGILEIMETGVVAGYPVTDVRVILHDGKMHPVDSNENAFRTAGRMCFRETFLKAKPVIREPIMEVEVTVPDEYMGDVMGDLSGHRGKILGVEARGGYQVVKALVPLKEMAKYSTKLRSMTQGRGIYRQKLSHYEEVPKEHADKLTKAYEEARAQGS
ncbi:MAG: elongation factor G [candidate division KSB1 bacterium]|nr:elongation factor G [candidate division KSB1 bacterium]MDZ7302436.1 elongation factor G [candidate division KSB1 bacterium]MDZ7311638.1 elongation factor G [candidate division KSB1 bacterium]